MTVGSTEARLLSRRAESVREPALQRPQMASPSAGRPRGVLIGTIRSADGRERSSVPEPRAPGVLRCSLRRGPRRNVLGSGPWPPRWKDRPTATRRSAFVNATHRGLIAAPKPPLPPEDGWGPEATPHAVRDRIAEQGPKCVKNALDETDSMRNAGSRCSVATNAPRASMPASLRMSKCSRAGAPGAPCRITAKAQAAGRRRLRAIPRPVRAA